MYLSYRSNTPVTQYKLTIWNRKYMAWCISFYDQELFFRASNFLCLFSDWKTLLLIFVLCWCYTTHCSLLVAYKWSKCILAWRLCGCIYIVADMCHVSLHKARLSFRHYHRSSYSCNLLVQTVFVILLSECFITASQ
jgi:hypothetical protein